MLKGAKTTNALAESNSKASATANSNVPVTPAKDAKQVTIGGTQEAKSTGKENLAASKEGVLTPAASKEPVRTSTSGLAFVKEAVKALSGGIADAIVDIRVSSNELQEGELSRNGYVQLLQDSGEIRRSTTAGISTFGNKSSIWIWRRSQGTCSGRLKPIIDIQLDSSSISSEFVLAGYTADPNYISGQTLWLKRATTEEEEKDAIIDLYVTTGRSKDTSDKIWSTPGVGWNRVDGNFSKSMFGSIDSFLWYRPARTRATEMQMTHPSKGAVALTDEVRLTKLVSAVRVALRNYISSNDIKRLSSLKMEGNNLSMSANGTSALRSERMADFSSHYHQVSLKIDIHSQAFTRCQNTNYYVALSIACR